MDIRLDGRAAVITGGSKGIGYGVAARPARETCISVSDQGVGGAFP
jgi:NAD(P)-dependent dehydrogenase (short-subunit alcohol dehydrogenase family)